MSKKQAKSTQEAISLSGEQLWAELEKIGFYGTNLKAQVIATPTPWAFMVALVSNVVATNYALSSGLNEEYAWDGLAIDAEDWDGLLKNAQTAQSANLALRERIKESKRAK